MENLIVTSKKAASIEWNKEKAINDANEIMKKYEGVVFQEEDLKDAKKEIATLRKVSKEINAQALAIDKELTANVKEFRNEVKEVKAIVDKGISYIDNQVKEFEDAIKTNRMNEIMEWEEYKAIQDYIPFNNEWLLKKWTDDKLIDLLASHKEQLDTNIGTIKLTCNTLNVSPDFYIEKLKTTPYAQVIERINEDAQRTTKEEVKEVVIDKNEKILTITREMKGTKSQFIALKEYAEKIGIEWVK